MLNCKSFYFNVKILIFDKMGQNYLYRLRTCSSLYGTSNYILITVKSFNDYKSSKKICLFFNNQLKIEM